jgi:hypothetical protein
VEKSETGLCHTHESHHDCAPHQLCSIPYDSVVMLNVSVMSILSVDETDRHDARRNEQPGTAAHMLEVALTLPAHASDFGSVKLW